MGSAVRCMPSRAGHEAGQPLTPFPDVLVYQRNNVFTAAGRVVQQGPQRHHIVRPLLDVGDDIPDALRVWHHITCRLYKVGAPHAPHILLLFHGCSPPEAVQLH